MKNLYLTLCLFIFSPQSYAFTFNNSVAASFAEETVTINVADFSCDNNGLTLERLENSLRTAVNQYWNTVPSSRLKIVVGSRRTLAQTFNTDNPCLGGSGCTPNPDLVVDSGIVVACNNNAAVFSDPRILGVTLTNNIQGRRLVGSLILLNDRAGSNLGNRAEDQLVAVLAHELGHAIGLGHSPVKDSLMYFQTVPSRRSLGQDDRDGVSYLYPASIGSSACGTISNAYSAGGPQGPWPLVFLLAAAMAICYALKLVPRR